MNEVKNIREEVVVQKNDKQVILQSEFKDDDGERWYLIPCETAVWPNGNPHIAYYRTVWGTRMVIWLNEVGGLIFSQYA